MRIDISEIIGAFPDFRVAAIIVEKLEIDAERPPELADQIAAREIACRERWGKTELGEIPGVAAWRRAYRGFGVKKTSYRSSVERLVKNVLAGRGLPTINVFVDAYNAVSLAHVMPAGADDLDQVAGDIHFRYSRLGDQFLDMALGSEPGVDVPDNDPPKEGEVVYADDEKLLCRRWNWRQDRRSLVTPWTHRSIVTIQANGAGDLDLAVADFTALVGRFFGVDCAVAIADKARPVEEID